MAATQEQIDAISAALSANELTVKSDGILTTYRSIAEMIAARNDLLKQIDLQNAAAGLPRPRQTVLVHGGRGYREP